MRRVANAVCAESLTLLFSIGWAARESVRILCTRSPNRFRRITDFPALVEATQALLSPSNPRLRGEKTGCTYVQVEKPYSLLLSEFDIPFSLRLWCSAERSCARFHSTQCSNFRRWRGDDQQYSRGHQLRSSVQC